MPGFASRHIRPLSPIWTEIELRLNEIWMASIRASTTRHQKRSAWCGQSGQRGSCEGEEWSAQRGVAVLL